MSEYQKRTPERLIEILRSSDQNPRSWNQEAADEIASLRAQLASANEKTEEVRNYWKEISRKDELRAVVTEAQLASARKALEPFAGDRLPSLRRSEIAFDKYGLRRLMSPMEIAQVAAIHALTDEKGT